MTRMTKDTPPMGKGLTHAQARFQWRRWFAWRPVRTVWGHVLWREHVERRGGYDHRKNSDRPPPWRWEYRRAALAQHQGEADV